MIFFGYLVSLGKFLSSLRALSPLLKHICLFTLQKTFSQPAQNRGWPKQLQFIVFFFHTDVISNAFCITSGERLESPGLQGLLKTSSSSLGWSRVFVSVTSYFPTLIGTVKVPQILYATTCKFIFLLFLPWQSSVVFSLLLINYVCLRVTEVKIDHSEELCKLFTCFVTWSCYFFFFFFSDK